MAETIKPGQIKMNVNMNDLKDRICECGCKAFTKLFGLKELPILMSHTGHAETMMLHVGFICVACGKPMSMQPGDPAPGDPIDITPPGADDKTGPSQEPPEEKKSNIIIVGG